MIVIIGCSKERKPTYNTSPYTSETAINNSDVVDTPGKQYNSEKLAFIKMVQIIGGNSIKTGLTVIK